MDCVFERYTKFYKRVICLIPVEGAGGHTHSNHFCNKEACPIWLAYLNSLETRREARKEELSLHLEYLRQKVKETIEDILKKNKIHIKTQIRFTDESDTVEERELGMVFRSEWQTSYEKRVFEGDLGIKFLTGGWMEVTVIIPGEKGGYKKGYKKEYMDKKQQWT